MKPLKLEIQGLYSYREKERLDFRPFHRVRLFGIFGKTGDGKSSILDAITFALYGRLERLGGRSLKEAVNPAAGRLVVEFSFELDGQVFRVVRRFEPHSGTRAILYRQGPGGWQPLAEKAREVDAQLSHLLGLRFEEFTKVVILPQGKFAEFLKLTPARRAEMLESLFDLEIYGEALFQRVTTRLGELKAVWEEKKRRLAALEDVSHEQKKALETRLKHLLAEIANQQALFSQQKERLERLRQLERLLREKEILKEKEKALRARETEVRKLKEKLAQSQRLAPLRALLEEFFVLERDLPERRERLKRLAQKRDEAQRDYDSVREELRDFREEKEKEEERLQQKDAEARSLYQGLQELRKREEEARRLREEGLRLREAEQRFLAQSREIEKELASLEEAIQTKEEARAKISLSPQEEALLERLESLRGPYLFLQEKLKRQAILQEDLQREEIHFNEVVSKYSSLWRDTLAEDPPPLEKALLRLEEHLSGLREELRQMEANLQSADLALVLAEKLRPGEPCPVCGSRHHPRPAEPGQTNEIVAHLQREIQRLRQREKDLLKLRERIAPLCDEARLLSRRKEEWQRERESLENEVTRLKRELSGKLPEEVLATFEETFERLSRRKKESFSLLEELESLKQQARQLEAAKQHLQGQAALRGQEAHQRQERLREIEEEMEIKYGEMKRRLGGLSPEEVLDQVAAERRRLKEREEELLRKERAQREELLQLETKLKEEMAIFQEKENRYLGLSERLLSEADKEGFKDLEALRAALLEEDECQRIEATIRSWEETLAGLQERWLHLKKELNRLPLKEMPPGEPTSTERSLEHLERELAQKREEKGRLEAELRRLARDLEEKEKLLKEKEKLEKEIRLTDQLRQHLRGRALVTFAARHLFGEILERANLLLKDLLGERFLIRMAREAFSFSVYDLRLGHERPVETLSGGETFVVSFALALALSSYIQRVRARSIHFFFVDEGFGSLDEDLLEAVSEVLQELRTQDRLVGIITHLERFKQLLPAHVLVHKDITGTSRIRVCLPGVP